MNRLEVEGTTFIDWMNPGIYENQDYLVIGLYHTRAAADIRLKYDAGRDGWVVERDDGKEDPDWKEVAFIEA